MPTIALAPHAVLDRHRHTISNACVSATIDRAVLASLEAADLALEAIDDDTIATLAELGLAFVSLDGEEQHWTELIARLVCSAHDYAEQNGVSIFTRIANGEASAQQVEAWIISMFLFTKSAAIHTGEMLQAARRAQDNMPFWQALSEEESGHWKIYRRIFSELGLSHEAERARALRGAVKDLVDLLCTAAQTSEAHYAALLYPIEQGTDATTLAEDALFHSLVKYYGFSEAAAMPLFLHTTLNDRMGHSRIWIDIIRRRPVYSASEVDDILQISARLMRTLTRWGDEIERHVYSSADR